MHATCFKRWFETCGKPYAECCPFKCHANVTNADATTGTEELLSLATGEVTVSDDEASNNGSGGGGTADSTGNPDQADTSAVTVPIDPDDTPMVPLEQS